MIFIYQIHKKTFLSLVTGIALINGFLSSEVDILVPAAETPSVSHLSVLPSSQAYLAYAEHIHKFLSLPLVPFKLSNNRLFTVLREHGLLQEVSHDIIQRTVACCDLSAGELIEILRWLCTDEIKNDKHFIEGILSFVLFHDNQSSSNIMERVKFYSAIEVPILLPLATNVLPARIAMHISSDDLNEKLSLTALTLDNLVDFFLHKDQHFLLYTQNTVVCLFNLISKFWARIDPSRRETMKTTLSNIQCVPTTQGMKIPKEAYIRSPILSSDLALIELNVVKSMTEDDARGVITTSRQASTFVEASDNRVLAEFLKLIGCRTINIPSFVENQKLKPSALKASDNRLQILVQHLVDAYENLSEEDIEAIKRIECFPGKQKALEG